MQKWFHRLLRRYIPSAGSEMPYQFPLLLYLHLALILFLLIALVIVLIFTPDDKRTFYLCIAIASLLVVIALLWLNQKGYEQLSRRLTIAVMFLAPWASIIFENVIHSGDNIPMIFVIIPIQIAALYLSAKPMLIISTLQTAALIGLIVLTQNTSSLNWESLVCYIFIASLLGTITSQVVRVQYRKLLLSNEDLAVSEQRLRELSIHDPLSGLFNRRYIEERLSGLTRNVDAPFAILMLDVDHFKRINDTCGHSQGDFVIQAVARILTGSIRNSDIACRYGGDEFLIILIGCGLEDALRKAAEIRHNADALSDGCNGMESSAITLSVGIALFPASGRDAETLLRAADAALYRAKNEGRDRITVAPSSPA